MIMTYSLLFLIAVMLFGIFKLVKFGESQQDTNTHGPVKLIGIPIF
ncbi:TPA: hypothetical protein ACFB1R_000339 [Neisseria gonorrhoeae]